MGTEEIDDAWGDRSEGENDPTENISRRIKTSGYDNLIFNFLITLQHPENCISCNIQGGMYQNECSFLAISIFALPREQPMGALLISVCSAHFTDLFLCFYLRSYCCIYSIPVILRARALNPCFKVLLADGRTAVFEGGLE